MFNRVLQEFCRERGPAGLMTGAAATAGFAVEIFVKQHEIAPVWVIRVLRNLAVTRAHAILVRQKDTSQPSGKLTRYDLFDAPYASMVHDFMVTRNYVLFPVLPLTGSIQRALSGKPAYAWEADKRSYVGVLKRNADVSTIRWFECDPCYVFHPMNAYEDGDRIVGGKDGVWYRLVLQELPHSRLAAALRSTTKANSSVPSPSWASCVIRSTTISRTATPIR